MKIPFSLFSRREELLALDIGSGAVKMVELSGEPANPTLESFAIQSIDADVFSNNSISKPELLADIITKICDINEVESKRVVVGLPAPAVFTKRIKMPKQGEDELRSSIQFEAANFIPHKIDAVKLDYSILGDGGKNQLDVLVVAVKKELLESLEDCLALAGLECAIADVDFFALHNSFEQSQLRATDKSSGAQALVSFGYRYSSLSISKDGIPIFVGDVSIGLKQLEEELALKLNLHNAQCRSMVQTLNFDAESQVAVQAYVDQVSQELSRQLSFFWSACGVEGNISKIQIAGGGALLPGFVETLARKSGIEAIVFDPFANMKIAEEVDLSYLRKVAPLLAVATGLGLRAPGDGS